MSDTDDDFSKAFEGFGEDPNSVTPPVDPVKEEEKPTEEPKKEDDTTTPPTDPPKKDEEDERETPPVDDKKTEEKVDPPKDPEAPPVEAPQPLTKDDVKSVVSDLLNTERSSSKELENTTNEVIEKYYPDGLSNVLVDEKSGKELRTPADVVAASGDQMSTEEAAQWLLNEQFKLDKQLDGIKNQAKEIATTTLNFKRDAVDAVKKYEPLFKAYPQLQQKVYDKLMKQVKVDEAKGVILSSPDVMEHYDDYLEPYQQAYELGTKQAATNPTDPPVKDAPKITAEDRMDVAGDGGQSPVDDPTDFAQQVSKELAKGI